MKPGGQRRKGHSWERAVAAMLRPIFGDKVQRGFQTRGGGKEAPDVDGTPYHLECKHGRLVNLRAAMAQAVRDTDGRIPVVVAKDDRTQPVALMLLDDWLILVERADAYLKQSEGLRAKMEAELKAAKELREAKENFG